MRILGLYPGNGAIHSLATVKSWEEEWGLGHLCLYMTGQDDLICQLNPLDTKIGHKISLGPRKRCVVYLINRDHLQWDLVNLSSSCHSESRKLKLISYLRSATNSNGQ